MEIRQVTTDERVTTTFPLQAYAFSPSPGPDDEAERYQRRQRFFTTATSFVAEEAGETLAGAASLPMRQNVRGLVHDMAGVAAVASHPSARRRGLVRELMTRLLRHTREQGCAVSALYPFRPSFYARFGYVGIPKTRKARFAPEGLSELLRRDLPGSVQRLPIKEGFAAYEALEHRLLAHRHGFAVFDETRSAEFREEKAWVALARVDGEVVGALRYRIDGHGGDLLGSSLFSTGPLGRALLLQFLARHVDQVSAIEVYLGADELAELWGTDMTVTTSAAVDSPTHNAPMVRVLDVPALAGSRVGRGGITVEIVGDDLIGGVWQFGADDGQLTVKPGGVPEATLTVGGFSALVYGALDPVEVFTRGLGDLDAEAMERLGVLFPTRMPYMFADF
ncbi:GNAT family N-acetyltransferase [Actinoplanes sp. HUAS TT8]|uniref:GNAT family N-acetyltransferase n=1 Tax=Actinoplanes sp. HUAS TT8 TaxID=3447453 RepID=UPI003F52709A